MLWEPDPGRLINEMDKRGQNWEGKLRHRRDVARVMVKHIEPDPGSLMTWIRGAKSGRGN